MTRCRWVDDDAALAELIDDGHRRATVRDRHRVPPRAHLLPAAGAGAARLAAAAIGPRRPARRRPEAASPSCSTSDAVAVLHAAQQDLDVLDARGRWRPAAHLRHPGRGELHRLRNAVARGRSCRASSARPRPRATDSPTGCGVRSRRRRRSTPPPTSRYLLALQDRLDAKLARLGRSAWALEACEELRARPTGGDRPRGCVDPAEGRPNATARVRGRSPRRSRRGAKREAQSLDMPVRQVLPDLAILGISQRQPTTLEELAQCRGVDDRHRRGRVGQRAARGRPRGQHADAAHGRVRWR